MTPEQWAEVESHFATIVELPAAERDAALGSVHDDAVRNEVASLLRHSSGGETVAAAIGAMASSVEERVLQEQQLGPYKLMKRLGQGGQGAVFEGVRADGRFQQKVAIKLIKWESDNEVARERFRQERRMLAGLEHPHIARLLDGGETAEGSPYLVLEFVDGLPLTTAAHDWPLRRKLELFVEVAEAVTFAHRNLIVHRDLKPANILVTKDGTPKLLDFGIAKLLDTNATRTLTGLQALTPDYASPEQVRGEPITTASDVYSLGVVLYELLTGRRPYAVSTLTPLEMDRVICRQPPETPGLGDELDAILLMALRKEPERRYGSVQEFAGDILRFLDNRPVLARPDTLTYRTGKYVRRHWVGLAAASIALAGICSGAAVAIYQARIAQQRFEQVRKLAHSFVFDYHDELAKVQGNTAVREKMVGTALQYLDILTQSAGNDASLQAEVASAYRKIGDTQGNPSRPNLGHTEQAIASYRKAATIYDRLARNPKYGPEVGEFYTSFATLLMAAGDLTAAEHAGMIALRDAQQLTRDHPTLKGAQVNLTRSWDVLGDIDDSHDDEKGALEKYRKGQAEAQKLLDRWPGLDSMTLKESVESRVASLSMAAGSLSEALVAFDEDQRLLEGMLKLTPQDPGVRHSYGLLAQYRSQIYYDDLFPSLEDPARALPYARDAVESARTMVAHDPNDFAAAFSLAVTLYRVSFPLKHSDPAGAVVAAEESVRLFDEQVAAGKKGMPLVSRRIRGLHRLAEALVSAARMEEARIAAVKALAEERAWAPSEDKELKVTARLALALVTSAQVAEASHDWHEAESFLTEAEQTARKFLSHDTTATFRAIPLSHVQEAWAAHWQKAGDAVQAKHWIEESARLWRNFPDQNEFVRRQAAKFAVAQRP